MLSILTYASKQELENRLSELLPPEAEVKWVAPAPVKADALRTRWAQRNRTDVVTWSRFLQDACSHEIWRKSRLLLQLNAFRNLVPELREIDYGTFKNAYQVFSDLRAYIFTPEIPDEILAEFDSTIATMVQLFHQGARVAGIMDEHAATFELVNELRGSSALRLGNSSHFVFEGFTFFNPAQLSLLEALSIRHQVYVPIPATVFLQSQQFDWPRTLELSAQIIESTQEALTAERSLDWVNYPTGNLGRALKSWSELKTDASSVVLASKELDVISLQELPFADSFIRYPVDLTEQARQKVLRRLQEHGQGVTSLRPAAQVLDWLQAEMQKLTLQKELALMAEYSVLQQLQTALSDLTSCLVGQSWDHFFVQLLAEVLTLDAPRAHLIALLSQNEKVSVHSLKTIHALRTSGSLALCIDSSYGTLKSDHRPFTPQLESILGKLGPLRRPELEFLYLAAELSELWNHPQLTLLIEEGLLDHDVSWRRALAGIRLNPLHLPEREAISRMPLDYFFNASTVFDRNRRTSASQLQDYFDCPRKFYATKVHKLIPYIDPTHEISPAKIGEMEHRLIAEAWQLNNGTSLSTSELVVLARQLLSQNPVYDSLSPIRQAAALNELVIYARNGFEKLLELRNHFPDLEFHFEFPLELPDKSGYVDCWAESPRRVLVLDFKRAKSDYPGTKTWFENYSKIQLWFYLQALREMGKIHEGVEVGAGYIFLRDISKSWLALSSSWQQEASARGMDWVKAWERPQQDIERYHQLENELREKLTQDQFFVPQARDAKVCQFCELRPLCPRPLSGDEEEVT